MLPRSARPSRCSPPAPADRLEDELFRPVQKAYVRTKRTRTGFAQRVARETDEPEPKPVGPPSQGAKGFIQEAVAASTQADLILSELQDSMMPVEGGDGELRAGLSEIRELLSPIRVSGGDVPANARSLGANQSKSHPKYTSTFATLSPSKVWISVLRKRLPSSLVASTVTSYLVPDLAQPHEVE